MAQHGPGPARAAATAPSALAAAVGGDLIIVHPQWKAHLQHFNRRVHCVGDAGSYHVDAVLAGPGTGAALDGLIRDIATAIARILAAEGDHGAGALAARHHVIGHEVGQSAKGHVADSVAHLVVGVDHGRREFRVHHRALGRCNRNRPPRARVRRDQAGRVNYHLQRAINAAGRHRQRRVDGARHLWIGTSEVDRDGVALFHDLHADPEDGVFLLAILENAVAVAKVLERAFAVRQLSQHQAHHALGIVHDLRHDGFEPLRAMLGRQCVQALAGPPVSSDLRA